MHYPYPPTVVALCLTSVLLFGMENNIRAQSGSRRAPAASVGGSTTRSARPVRSTAPARRVSPASAGLRSSAIRFQPSPITVPHSASTARSPGTLGVSGGSFGPSGFPSRSSLGRTLPVGSSQRPGSLVPLSTATPPQYLQRNSASLPTGHSTGVQFFSHYYQQ